MSLTADRAKRSRNWLRWAGLGIAAVVALLVLDTVGLLRPLPRPQEVLQRMQAAWGSVQTYSAGIVMLDGRGASTSRAKLRWERSGRVGISAPDYGGFYHHQVLAGDRRTYYQPGAEIVGETEIRGLRKTPFAPWMVTGFPGLHDVVHVLQRAREVSVVGRSEVSGGRSVILRVVPTLPADGIGTSEADAALYRNRLGVPWAVHVSESSHLPLRVHAAEGGWGVEFGSLELNPSFPAESWRLGEGKAVRRVRLSASARDLESVFQAQRELDREINQWKGRMMSNARRPGMP